MPKADNAPEQPAGITPSDALTRCLNILDKVDDEGGTDHYDPNGGTLSPRARIVRALAAFYDVPFSVHRPEGDPNDR